MVGHAVQPGGRRPGEHRPRYRQPCRPVQQRRCPHQSGGGEYRPEKHLDIEFYPGSHFFVERIEYTNPTRSVFDDWLYRPALDALRGVARRAQAIQSGSANVYLAYILAALLLLLVLA